MNKAKKIIEYGLYLLVFLLPVQTRWIIKAGETEYGTMSLYLVDIVLLIILLCFVSSIFQRQNFQFSIFNFQLNYNFLVLNYWFYIIIIDLAVFISIFFADNFLLAVYKYGVFLLAVGLFWLIIKAEYNGIKLMLSLLGGILVQAILGIWQFFTQSSFSSKWLGIAIHRSGDLGVSVIETLKGERWLRAYGGLDHPNILGGLLVIGLLVLVSIVITQKIKISSLKTVLLFYSSLVIMLLSLFFTFSRSAWLGLVFGLLVMLTMSFVNKDEYKKKKVLEILLISVALILVFINFYSSLILTRLSGEARLEIKSANERIELLSSATEIVKENWLFGVGAGNYTLESLSEPVHNTFLLIWAEAGIFSLIAFLGLLTLFIKKKSLLTENSAILIALIVMMILDHWWWSLHSGILFLFLILGLALRDKRI